MIINVPISLFYSDVKLQDIVVRYISQKYKLLSCMRPLCSRVLQVIVHNYSGTRIIHLWPIEGQLQPHDGKY